MNHSSPNYLKFDKEPISVSIITVVLFGTDFLNLISITKILMTSYTDHQ